AKKILTENRDKLELIAEALLEFETLDGAHIIDLIEHGEMKSPPRSPKPPELPSDAAPTTSDQSDSDEREEGDGPLPDPVGAPA
ncbi:MAG TPA: cell division protein FtsH, partial [Verrucomicrobiales bacterium]|nr:cell division protein FtsH [Verrucomicrobiales bacterium]